MDRPAENDPSKSAGDSARLDGDIADLARDAIAQIRKAMDEFAAKADAPKPGAADRAAGTAEQRFESGLGSLADEAIALAETGLERLGQSVIRNPVGAIAIAAGVGLIFGLLSGRDRR